ncbi:MAG: hypothetical protein IT518_06995 [Burkholderiales bacterium]|nr:hypothetical protein [Burkholderiales bacterium]
MKAIHLATLAGAFAAAAAQTPGRRSSAALQLGHTLEFFDDHLKQKTGG